MTHLAPTKKPPSAGQRLVVPPLHGESSLQNVLAAATVFWVVQVLHHDDRVTNPTD